MRESKLPQRRNEQVSNREPDAGPSGHNVGDRARDGEPHLSAPALAAWAQYLASNGTGDSPADDGDDQPRSARELATSIRNAASESFAGVRLVPGLLAATQPWRASGLTLAFTDANGVGHRYEGSNRGLPPVHIERLDADHYRVHEARTQNPVEITSKEGNGFYFSLWKALLDPTFDGPSQAVYQGHEPGRRGDAAQYFRRLIAGHVERHGLPPAISAGPASGTRQQTEGPKAGLAEEPSDEGLDSDSDDEDVPSNVWQRSGADTRANWELFAAQRKQQPMAPFRARNLAQRVAAMLYGQHAAEPLLRNGAPQPDDATRLMPAPPSRDRARAAQWAASQPAAPRAARPAAGGAEAEEAWRVPTDDDTSTRPNAHEAAGPSSAGARVESMELVPLTAAGAVVLAQAADARPWAFAGDAYAALHALAASAGGALREPRRAAQALTAGTLLGFVGYAWYSMFGSPPPARAADEPRGALTDEERDWLDSLASLASRVAPSEMEPSSEEPTPFGDADLTALERIVGEASAMLASLGAQVEPARGTRVKRALGEAAPRIDSTSERVLQSPSQATPRRSKRDASEPIEDAQTTERKAYWGPQLSEAQAQQARGEPRPAAEMRALTLLAEQRGSTVGAAPRASIPWDDTYFTRMDRLDASVFDATGFDVFDYLTDKARSVANSPLVDYPASGPGDALDQRRWMHLGRFWDVIYIGIVVDWGLALGGLDASLSSQFALAEEQVWQIIAQMELDAPRLKAAMADDPALKQSEAEFTVHSLPGADVAAIRSGAIELRTLHAQLQRFDPTNRAQLAAVARSPSLYALFSRVLPRREFSWQPGSLSHLDKIDLSNFNAGFADELVRLLQSLLDYESERGAATATTPTTATTAPLPATSTETSASKPTIGGEPIDLVQFFATLNLVALNRAYEALQQRNLTAAQNYASLDEAASRILDEDLDQLRDQAEKRRFEADYELVRSDVLGKIDEILAGRGEGAQTTPQPQPSQAPRAARPTTSTAAPTTPAVPSRPVNRIIPGSKVNFQSNSPSLLDLLRLDRRYDDSFMPKVRAIVEAVRKKWQPTGLVLGQMDLVFLWTEIGISVVEGLKESVSDPGKWGAPYNYALLDDEVTQIIDEYISRIWSPVEKKRFLTRHYAVRSQLPPPYGKTTTTTVAPPGSLETAVDWAEIGRHVDSDEQPETQRLNVRQVFNQRLEHGLQKYIAVMLQYAQTHERFLGREAYLDQWIMRMLDEAGVEVISPATQMTVGVFGGDRVPVVTAEVYTLREIVQGKHRSHQEEHGVGVRHVIKWPGNVDTALQEKLLTGFEADVGRDIATSYEQLEKQGLHDIYEMQAREAAVRYLVEKNARGAGRKLGLFQKAGVDAVTRFLRGTTRAKLFKWHGEPLPGVIFIPFEDVMKGDIGKRTGVLLSIWSGRYYEVPFPGLGASLSRVGMRPGAQIRLPVEERAPFREFVESHGAQRIAQARANLADPGRAFDYQVRHKQSIGLTALTTTYTAPFETAASDDYLAELIGLQKRDLTEFHTSQIFSAARAARESLHLLFNHLAISTGIVMMGAGLVVGGPAWAYVMASMAATLLLDVAPNAVLAAHADTREEQQRYIYSLVLAIGLEVAGNVIGEIGGPIFKAGVLRLARQAATSTRTAAPALFEAAAKVFERAAAHWSVEPLRRVANEIRVIGKGTRDELERIIRSLDAEIGDVRDRAAGADRADVHEPPRPAGPGGSAEAPGAGASVFAPKRLRPAFGLHRKQIHQMRARLVAERFEVTYRVVSQWASPTQKAVRNEFLMIARRGGDVVVVTKVTEKNAPAYLFTEENAWMSDVQATARAGNTLVKYLDFDDFDVLARQYPALANYEGQLSAHQLIENAMTVYAPPAYREAVRSRTGLDYDAIQGVLEKTRRAQAGAVGLRSSDSFDLPAGDPRAGKTAKDLQAEPPEPIRSLPDDERVLSDFTSDFDVPALLEEMKKNPTINEVLIHPHGKCDQLLSPLARLLGEHGFTNFRYRAMYMWINPANDPTNHFVLVATRNEVDYVFDLSAAQFGGKMSGFTGPVVARETDWALKYDRGSQRRLIKYRDFGDPLSAVNRFSQFAPKPAANIEGATILRAPKWYLSIRSAEVEPLVKLDETSVAQTLRGAHGTGGAGPSSRDDFDVDLGFELREEPILEPDPDWTPEEAERALKAAMLRKLGPDITSFYPLQRDLALDEMPPQLRQQRIAAYKRIIETETDIEVIGESLHALRSRQDLPPDIAYHREVVEEAFLTARSRLEQIAELMKDARDDPALKRYVIRRLAVFLNEKDPAVLSEAYRRLETIAARTYRIADYHVTETDLRWVVPVRTTNPESMFAQAQVLAYVYSQDPRARIMVLIENVGPAFEETIMHEMTHLSVGSFDFQYLRSPADPMLVASGEEAHRVYGTALLDEGSVSFGLGRMTAMADELTQIPVLTDHEKALAQARLTRLPMLRANAKMNNADSLVSLGNYLRSGLRFTSIAPSQWAVEIVDEARRTRRAAADPASTENAGEMQGDPGTQMSFADLRRGQLVESIMVAMFILSDSVDPRALSNDVPSAPSSSTGQPRH